MAHGSNKRALDKYNNGSKLTRVLISFITLCLVFMLGFFVRGNNELMDYMGIKDLLSGEEHVSSSVSMDPKNSLTARVAEVQSIIDSESYAYKYDLDDATKSVMSSFAKSADDGYVRYYTDEQYEQLRIEGSNAYTGIGVLLGSYKNKAYVVEVFEGSEAQAKGIEVGDFVDSIDDQTKKNGWTLTEAITAISSRSGHVVSVTWRKANSLDDAGGELLSTYLQCSSQKEKNVSSKLQGNVGYIKVRQLGRTTASSVGQAIVSLSEKGAKGYVLDLRNVPGGYLTQAVEICSLFQDSGVVVQVQTRTSTTSKSVTGGVVTDAPLVILVNKNTAAAAEVIAAALQDASRATVVGQTTMGKGSVQVMRELSFGGAFSYTAAYYQTPRGRDIDGVGVDPDVKIANRPNAEKDYERSTAINTIRSIVGE